MTADCNTVPALLLEAATGLTALGQTSPQSVSEDDEPCASVEEESSSTAPSYVKLKSASFPERLMMMMSDPEASKSIMWLPDGNSFVISSPLKLTLEILPRYFGQAEFSSFTRKLYWWGFRKTSRMSCDSFQHEMFRRDEPELAKKMKGTQMRKRNSKSKKAINASRRAAASGIESEVVALRSVANTSTGVPKVLPPSVAMRSIQSIGIRRLAPFNMSASIAPMINTLLKHPTVTRIPSPVAPHLVVGTPPPTGPIDLPVPAASPALQTQLLAASRLAATPAPDASLNLPTFLDMPTRPLILGAPHQQHHDLPVVNSAQPLYDALASIQARAQQQHQRRALEAAAAASKPPVVIHVHHHRVDQEELYDSEPVTHVLKLPR